MIGGFRLMVCAGTDVGLTRRRNEDSYLAAEGTAARISNDRQGAVFAVADGMGGHPGGDIASRMAVQDLEKHYRIEDGDIDGDCKLLLDHLEKRIYAIHDRIETYGRHHPALEGLGTTLSVLALAGGRALMAHVGDSRIYRLRQGRLEQMTSDHTLVGHFVESGVMTDEEARKHPLRHVMMQAVGHGVDEVFTRVEKLRRGDIFLLCSDGLHDRVPPEEIRKILLDEGEHGRICRRLVESALRHGGRDNVTVVAIRVVG